MRRWAKESGGAPSRRTGTTGGGLRARGLAGFDSFADMSTPQLKEADLEDTKPHDTDRSLHFAKA
jgi:hypothetical protein